MADKSSGLGKLLAKSKSTIRRARKGSVSVGSSNSFESDDATSAFFLSRDHSDASQLFPPSLPAAQDDATSIVIRVPALGDKDDQESTSLVSSSYDSEDPEPELL